MRGVFQQNNFCTNELMVLQNNYLTLYLLKIQRFPHFWEQE